jgi:5'-phosphate synthase pdxT subunit
VTVRRNAFGRQVDSFEAEVAIDAIPGGPLRAVFIRAPWVEELGPGAQALGRVSAGSAVGGVGAGTGAGRIVVVRQQHLLATSFHPELTGDGRVHQYFVEMVRGNR